MEQDTADHRSQAYKDEIKSLTEKLKQAEAREKGLMGELVKIRELSYHVGCDDYPCTLDVIRVYCESALKTPAQKSTAGEGEEGV